MTARLLKFEPRKVGVWMRVSTEFQVQGDSLEHHEARAREYASSKEWDIVETYQLEAVSGKSVLKQSETQRMLKDVRSGKINALIVSKFARLVRNTRELLEICDVFTENKAEIISLDEPINITTSSGRLFLSIMGSLAEWEREEIGARVAASVPIRAKLGKSLGGAAPFGHKWEGKQLVLNPAEAPVRKLMFELFLTHKRKKRVARLLNEAGHRTRNGGLFTDTTVDRLLRDPHAKGLRRANYTRSLGNKKHWMLKPRSDWVMVPIEPIVSTELYDQVKRILDVQRGKLSRSSKMAVQLFGGLLHCECGKRLYKGSATPKYVCCGCRNKIPVADMEQVFVGAIRSLFMHEKVEVLLERAEHELAVKRARETLLNEQLVSMRDEMDKCYRAYVAGHLDQHDLGRFYDPLKIRSRGVEEVLAELRGDIDVLQKWCAPRKEVISKVHILVEKWWPAAPFEQKREMVENFVKKVQVRKNTVAIHFHHLAPFQPNEKTDFGALALLCGLEVVFPKDPQRTEIVGTLEELREQIRSLSRSSVA
jgi:site-specific DNA recombinase